MFNLGLWVNYYTFKDPASSFAYYLFSTHHIILWYLIIILVLVYWCLYKIIKDFSWKIFNKQEGVLVFLVNSYILRIRVLFSYSFYLFSVYCFKLVAYCFDLRDMYNLGFCSSKSEKVSYYLCLLIIYLITTLLGIQQTSSFIWESGEFVEKYEKPVFSKEFLFFDSFTLNILINDFLNWNLNYEAVETAIYDKYVSTTLYHYTSNGYFFNGVLNSLNFYKRSLPNSKYTINNNVNVEDTILRDTFLEAHEFKHSTAFEFVWAFFPSVIIISILIPSLYLLYSLDEDLDPKLVIKVIGHQWYWSYEFNNWVEVSSQVFEYISFKYDSMIVQSDELEFGTKRLLEVDKRLVVPVNVPLRFLITSVTFYIHEQYLS